MKSFKQQCIALRKKDHTLNEIVSITGRSKSSIYEHIRTTPLSNQKQEIIHSRLQQRARALAARRKGKALRPFKPFTYWSPELVLLVSHLVFDGEIVNKRCVYNNRSKALITRVEKLMLQVYDYSPRKVENKDTGVTRIEYRNIELQTFLSTKAEELMTGVEQMPLESQREFLRAFFDDEGSMDVRLNQGKRRVRGFQKDISVLHIVQRLLNNFDIKASLQGANEVVVSGKENLIRFQIEVNFSRGVRLNPYRKNSLWKKPIEKRKLLKIAIDSFVD